MDTSSHILIGFGLGALSQIDPYIANNPTLSQAVLLGTVLGSNAPDFDYVYHLKSKGSYLRHHRGWSHSLPVLPLLALAISSCIYIFFPSSFIQLFLWTFLAVILHVLLDVLNVYGTQVLRPFSTIWVSHDSLPLVDPYILILHLAGFSLLPFFHSGEVFLFIYLLMMIYILCRLGYAEWIKRYLKSYFRNAVHIKLIPRAEFLRWDVLIETKEDYLFGVYSRKTLSIELTIEKRNVFPGEVLESTNDHLISSFLSSTNYAIPIVKKRKDGYFVIWKDLRFRTNKFFTCLAIFFVSNDFNASESYTGRIYSMKQYKKVLKKLQHTTSIKEAHYTYPKGTSIK